MEPAEAGRRPLALQCHLPRRRRGGRAVECTGLENRQPFTGLVSSNLTLSANCRVIAVFRNVLRIRLAIESCAVIVEGTISGLIRKAFLIDFRVGGQLVCVERSAAASRLREGDRVRVSLQDDGEHLHVTAFQRSGEEALCAGPQTGFALAILSGLLVAAGISSGLVYLLVSATALACLELLLAADRRTLRAKLRRA